VSPRNDCQGCAWIVKIKTLKGRLIAHQFNTEWAVGMVKNVEKHFYFLKLLLENIEQCVYIVRFRRRLRQTEVSGRAQLPGVLVAWLNRTKLVV